MSLRSIVFNVHARRILRVLAGALLIAAAGVVSRPAFAAPVDWNGNRFVYATNGSRVADTLRTFAAGQHLPLRISGTIDGEVSGRFSMPPRQFLDMLCATYGLVWYFDGAVLQVSSASAQRHLTIAPHYLDANALRRALLAAGVADERFLLHADAAAGTLSVYGPADYVAALAQAAERLEADARARVRTTVRLVHLRVATAADQTRVIDGHDVVVPGVATRLRQRLHRASHAMSNAAPNAASDAAGADAPLEFDMPLPVVEADAATNSILLRDVPERIDGDAVLVADADVRPELVALQTWIVDVPADALPALQQTLPAPLAPATPVTAADGARALLARLAALEQTGGARLQVSRTAFTFDRAPAVFDRHEARRLVQIEDAEEPNPAAADDSNGVDVWLSVAPTVETGGGPPRVSLQLDWTRPAAAARHDAQHRSGSAASASVLPGDALVVLGVPGDASPGDASPGDASQAPMRRVIVVVPRIVA